MRYLLLFTAVVLALLTALRFVGEATPSRPFEGRRILVIAGGKPSGSFVHAAERGARKAERDLGCEVDVFATEWIQTEEVSIFQEQMASAPDGICLVGNPSNEALAVHIQDAYDADIQVTTYYRPMPALENSYRSMGFGFAGPDFHAAGFDLVEAAVLKHGLEPGARVLLIGDPERFQEDPLPAGCTAAANQYGLVEEFLPVRFDDTDRTRRAIQEWLSNAKAENTAPGLICYLQGPLEPLISGLASSGFKAGEIPVAAMGVDKAEDEKLSEHESSFVSLLITEDIQAQVYLAILQICLVREYTAPGMHIKTPYKILGTGAPADAGSSGFVQIY